MPMTLGERLGALQERDFRLLFTATTITTVGDRFAGIARLRGARHLVGDGARDRVRGAPGWRRSSRWAAASSPTGCLQPVPVGAALVQDRAGGDGCPVLLADVGGVPAIAALRAVYGLGSGSSSRRSARARPPDRERGTAPAGHHAGNDAEHGRRAGASGRRRGRRGRKPRDRARDRRGELLRLRGHSPPDPAFRPGTRPARSGHLAELREGWQEFRSRTWLWASVGCCSGSGT